MNQVIKLSAQQTILFDDNCLPSVTPELFSPRANDHNANVLGRGSVYFFNHEGLNLVLRHYRRGGIVRHFIKDNYIYSGLQSTRMWQEFYLLQKLQLLDLPVPRPVAVRCAKTSWVTYKGDLITEQIPNSQTLAQFLQHKTLCGGQWSALGFLLARFHSCNVYHADLNANNILIDSDGEFHLIDFDRCDIRSGEQASSWKVQNLERLLRSFAKQQKVNPSFHFSLEGWQLLQDAYLKASS